MRQGDPLGKTERGSGRTYRQLEKLQPGDVFVVNNHAERDSARRMIHEHFLSKGVLVVVADTQQPDRLRGWRIGTWIEVDHYLMDLWLHGSGYERAKGQRWLELITMTNSRSERQDEP